MSVSSKSRAGDDNKEVRFGNTDEKKGAIGDKKENAN
jgi:hypothetical protein